MLHFMFRKSRPLGLHIPMRLILLTMRDGVVRAFHAKRMIHFPVAMFINYQHTGVLLVGYSEMVEMDLVSMNLSFS